MNNLNIINKKDSAKNINLLTIKNDITNKINSNNDIIIDKNINKNIILENQINNNKLTNNIKVINNIDRK